MRAQVLLTGLLTACTATPVLLGEPVDAALTHPWELAAARVDLSGFDVDGAERVAIDLGDGPVDAWLSKARRAEGRREWIGALDGEPGSELALVAVGETWAGTLRTADRLFQLRPDGEGAALAVELDPAAMPPDAEPVPGPTYRVPDMALDHPRGALTRADVLVVFTAEALAGAGSRAALEATIALAETESNHGLAKSGIDHRLRIVGTAPVSGAERGADWGGTLTALKEPGDGFADEVHALRESLGADHVVLLVEEASACGIAYVMTEVTPLFSESAFAVVSRSCATGYYSFAHELGHNMGSAHHEEYGEAAAFPFSYGHRDPDGLFRTIMAYNCPGGCQRLNRWSDPKAFLDGAPLGVSGTGEGAADNARALALVHGLVADFRPQVVPDGALPARLLSPVGDVIVGGAAALSWTDTDGAPVRISVGAYPGDASIAAIEPTGTSAVLADLPTDGSAFWIRLETLLAGKWQAEDSRFVGALADAPAFVSPTAGAAIDPAEARVVWADAGEPRYRLQVGTRAGEADVLDVITVRHDAWVREAPVGELFARLGWEEADGGWRWAETRFVAR